MQALFENVASGGAQDDHDDADARARAAEEWAQRAVGGSSGLTLGRDPVESSPSSGRIDIGALVHALRSGETSDAPPAAVVPMTMATASAGRASHGRGVSFAWGAALSLSLAAAIVITPSLVRLARGARAGAERAAHAVASDRGARASVGSEGRGDRASTPSPLRSGSAGVAAATIAAPLPPTRVQVVTAIASPTVALAGQPIPTEAAPAIVAEPARAAALAPVSGATGRTATRSQRAAARSDAEAVTVPLPDAESATEAAPSGDVAAPSEAAVAVAGADVPPSNPFDAPAPASAPPLETAPAPEAAPAPPPETAPSRAEPAAAPSLDRLLDDAIGLRRDAPATREAAPAPVAPEPESTPSRAEVDRALEHTRAAVSRCAADGRGTASVRITISGASGRVTSAVVEGELAGTPAGSCVARAVREATFPTFTRPTFTIQYPFRL